MRIQLPSELEARFGQLRWRLWRVQSLEALLAIIVALGVSYLAVFVSDRGGDTLASVRAAILLGGLVVSSLAAMRWIFRWIIKRPEIKHLAVLVQRRYRQLGDRLLGIVELANEASRPAHFSEELYEAAIEQVSADALSYDFEKAVSTRGLRRLVVASFVLGILLIGLWGAVPGAARNAFARWLAPHRDIPRYTLVRIEALKAKGVVVHGEPFEVTARVRYESFWKPKVVYARFGTERPLKAFVQGGILRVEVPSQHDPRVLDVGLGDTSARLSIEPVFRPKLVEITGQEAPPSYLGYSAREVKISGSVLNVLEGSQVSFHGKISRNLESASLVLEEGGEQALAIDGSRFSCEALSLTNIVEASLSWRDELGLENTNPWAFVIRHYADQEPSIDLPELGFDSAILDTEVLALRVVTRDDFGVNEFGLNWQTNLGPQPSTELLEDEFHDGSLNRSQTELEATFYFSPAIFEIPAGATVEFQGFATDYYPGRMPVETLAYRVHVVSSAEHAELIRSRLESLLTNLEEISRLQEKLTAATAELRDHLDLDPAVIENRLQDQLDDQAMNAAQLSHLAQQGIETLREAMRNARFTDEMMKQWAEIMANMQSLAQQKMSEASRSLRSAQRSAKGRAQNLADAQQTQEDILQALEEMQRDVNEDMDQMEAMTLAQRLRAIGTGETEIEEALMQQAAETIGLFPNELAPRFQAANERLSEVQAEASEESKAIQEEISRFFERTEREAYGEVSKAMKESNVVEGLLDIRDLIEDNVTMRATEELARWAAQYDEWGDLLEPELSDDPSSGSGDGGENELDLTKHLMALLRLRESELTLRVQTRLLNGKREDPNFFVEQISELAESQVGIQERLVDVLLENPLPDIDAVLDEAHVQMDEVVELLNQNNAGDETVEGETNAINIITDAINMINEQAQRRGSRASAMAQHMAMMMQMTAMGKGRSMAPNPSGSGSQAGGDTDQAVEGLEGDAKGSADESRGVSRTSGMSESLPTEFRRVFEHYFRELEQLEATLPMPTLDSPTGSPKVQSAD
ncbi:MAG: hypothetical protein M2R45_03593 [Verrucomicrobia subdivision 3 bacterium]|nr:hypothetical protein [Limisphaerales bacterium]MCS1414775.1 hypothetical protein [Limisphaerales bacterium]